MTTRIVDRLKIGPFVTPERKSEWESSLEDALERLIQEQIIPQLTTDKWKVEGSFGSRFDDRRFYGPNSILKHRYQLELSFVSEEGVEKINCELDFDPTNRVVRALRKPLIVDTIPMQLEQHRKMKMIYEIIDRRLQGEESIVCPFCGKLLEFWVQDIVPKVMGVNCPTKGCFNIHFD